jgi:hypothetical protein
MHGTTLAVTKPALFAENLQQHIPYVAALGNTMSVATMGAADEVLVFQLHACPNSNGFLPAVEVNETGYVARFIFQAHTHFEFPDGFQAPVCVE